VDKFPKSRRKDLIVNNLIWIGANLTLYFTPISLDLYLLIQICWGLAIGANGPLIFSYLGDLFEINYRGRLFSIFATGLYFIKGSSNALTGLMGNLLGSWKEPSLIMAIGGIIVITLYAVGVKEPSLAQIEPEFKDQIASGKEYKYHLKLTDLKAIISQKTNLLFLIQGFFGTMGVTIVNRYIFYWFTSNLKDGMGIQATLTVILLALSGGIGALFGINIAGRYADIQFNKGRLDKMLYFSIICLFGQIITYACLIFLPTYPTNMGSSLDNPLDLLNTYPVFWQFFIIFNICLFFGTGIGPIVGMARTHINLPEHRGTAAALYDTTDFLGAGVALILGGIFATAMNSFRLTIFFGALFWIVSGLLWIAITKVINQDYMKLRDIMEQRAQMDSTKAR
jgi:MFS family permease